LLFSIFFIPLVSCTKSFEAHPVGNKPAGFDDPMPIIWEKTLTGKEFDFGSIDWSTATSITIPSDVTNIDNGSFSYYKDSLTGKYMENECLENIFVEEGNPEFTSVDGVLYSKSYQTLYQWPIKKPFTSLRPEVKYFDSRCLFRIRLPKDFEIPDETVSIGYDSFYKTNLSCFHVKSKVQYMYHAPENLETLIISSSIVYGSFFTSEDRFSDLYCSPKNIIFEEGVKEIRDGHLSEYKYNRNILLNNTKSISFPSTLEAIGNICFPVNVIVKKYILPPNLKFLDHYAFDDYFFDRSGYPWWVKVDIIRHLRLYNTTFEYSNEIAFKYLLYFSETWQRSTYTEFQTYYFQGSLVSLDQAYLNDYLKIDDLLTISYYYQGSDDIDFVPKQITPSVLYNKYEFSIIHSYLNSINIDYTEENVEKVLLTNYFGAYFQKEVNYVGTKYSVVVVNIKDPWQNTTKPLCSDHYIGGVLFKEYWEQEWLVWINLNINSY